MFKAHFKAKDHANPHVPMHESCHTFFFNERRETHTYMYVWMNICLFPIHIRDSSLRMDVSGFITPKARCQLARLPASRRFERREKKYHCSWVIKLRAYTRTRTQTLAENCEGFIQRGLQMVLTYKSTLIEINSVLPAHWESPCLVYRIISPKVFPQKVG